MKLFRIGISASAYACVAAGAVAADAPKPDLVVAISVDQFAGGLYDQYRGKFADGFKRVIDDGVAYPNGYQSHAAMETCPGHSTLTPEFDRITLELASELVQTTLAAVIGVANTCGVAP
ncbi:MAG: hypothetical protein ABIT36_03375 [Steroidobacteraceae bacterium]